MPKDVPKSKRQTAAEADIEGFRNALGPFVTAADSTRMPMVFTDTVGTKYALIYVNQAFLDLTGFEEHEVMGQSFDFLMEQGTDADVLAEIRTAFEGARGLEPLVRYRCKDGRAIWLMIFIAPVRNEKGVVIQHFASFVNVTEQIDESNRLRALFKRAET